MTTGRRNSPMGMPAVRGNALTNLDAVRFEKELLKQYPQLKANEVPFSKDEVLVEEGLVMESRNAFLVVEGTLAERQTHFMKDEGRKAITLFPIGVGGIAFAQALIPAYAIQPAFTSVMAETNGRAYMLPAEWWEEVHRADKVGLQTWQFVVRQHLLNSCIEVRDEYRKRRIAHQIDADATEMAEYMLRENPTLSLVPGETLKKRIFAMAKMGKEAENRLADAEIEIVDLKEQLDLANVSHTGLTAEIERLKNELATAKERERTASEGSAQAFAYLESEQARQARSAAATWKLLEREFAKIPSHQLSPELKAAMLGLTPDMAASITGADIAQAVEGLFEEALEAPSVLPPEPVPVTKRSAPPHRNLPSFAGDDDEDREVTLVGVQSDHPPMLPAQKPVRKPATAFSGLAGLGKIQPPAPPRPAPQPKRSMTPLGVAPAPPLAPPTKYAIVAPASARTGRDSDAPDIEVEEAGRQTQDWGFASQLGTAPKK